VIRPASKTWINGLARSYDAEYDSKLFRDKLTPKEYEILIDELN
jgi:hypothetical protein